MLNMLSQRYCAVIKLLIRSRKPLLLPMPTTLLTVAVAVADDDKKLNTETEAEAEAALALPRSCRVQTLLLLTM